MTYPGPSGRSLHSTCSLITDCFCFFFFYTLCSLTRWITLCVFHFFTFSKRIIKETARDKVHNQRNKELQHGFFNVHQETFAGPTLRQWRSQTHFSIHFFELRTQTSSNSSRKRSQIGLPNFLNCFLPASFYGLLLLILDSPGSGEVSQTLLFPLLQSLGFSALFLFPSLIILISRSRASCIWLVLCLWLPPGFLSHI